MERKIEQARGILSLKTLLTQFGRAPKNNKWNNFPCPWCQGNSGVFSDPGNGLEFFKCHKTGCPTNNQGMEQIKLIEFESSISYTDARVQFLKMAGVWEDRERLAPSVMPGKAGRKHKVPDGLYVNQPALSAQETAGDEKPGEEPSAEEIAQAFPEAAGTLTAEHTEHTKSGTDTGQPQAEASQSTEKEHAGEPPALRTQDGEDVELILQCVEIIRAEQKASVSQLQRRLRLGYTRAARIMDVLEKAGIVGPSKGAEPRDIPTDWEGVEEKLRAYLALSPPNLKATTEATQPPPTAGEALAEQIPDKPETVQASVEGEAGSGKGQAAPSADKGNAGEPPALPPSGETPPPDDPEGLPPEDEVLEPVKALRAFYAHPKVILTDGDRAKLLAKRGSSAVQVTALGFRSSREENKEALLSLEPNFPMWALLDAGLYTQGDKVGEAPKPSVKFCGWGLAGFEKDEAGKKKPFYGWTYPVLIPYFDEDGEVVHLRPHKDMQKDKPSLFYPVRQVRIGGRVMLMDPPSQYAVITEGEFKAAALWEVLREEAACGALPGISMAKLMLGEIIDWLDRLQVRKVYLVYDNENKTDPRLPNGKENPSYKRESWDRYDTEVWVRLLARRLAAAGFDARVGHLPDKWRDPETGKADWDGALASFKAQGLADEQIKREFQAVLNQAQPPGVIHRSNLFDKTVEKTIFAKLENFDYERKLPQGGEDEAKTRHRILRCHRRCKGSLTKAERGFLYMLAMKYYDVSKGGYYTFRPLSEKLAITWRGVREKAAAESDTELRRICDLMLNDNRGIPQNITDFIVDAHYILVKLNGKRERVISLRNVHGARSPYVSLPSEEFSQPSKLRTWLNDSIAGATWEAGEREMNKLQRDLAWELSHREVYEVGVRGYHKESGIWFFGDCAYTPEGKEIMADKMGVFWHGGTCPTCKGSGRMQNEKLKIQNAEANAANCPMCKGEKTVPRKGYKPSQHDHEGQQFVQGMPMMHPEVKAERPELMDLFANISDGMFQTLGGFEGWLLLGEVLACAAGPEIYKKFVALPGMWIHGEARQGKSSVASWLLHVWGFDRETGLPLADSTKVGISIALQQYGELTVWLEEFQQDAAKWMIEKLKNAYNRESGVKMTTEGKDAREIRAQVMVTGVATASDAQLHSRYAHVLVSAKKRQANHYDWFRENSNRFYLLGRYLMRNRLKYVEEVQKAIDEWLLNEISDPRALRVYGTAYAGFAAMSRMLGNHSPKLLADYKKALLQLCVEHAEHVQRAVDVDKFWQDVLSCVSLGEMADTQAGLKEIFKVSVLDNAIPRVSEFQIKIGEESSFAAWISYRIYFNPDLLMDKLREYKRRRGQDLSISREDLRTQMQTRGYWVKTPKVGVMHRQRFGNDKRLQTCWAIDMDFHEQGRKEMSDEDFEASLYVDGNVMGKIFIQRDDWVDPRRGDLFKIVDELLSDVQQEKDKAKQKVMI